MRFHVLTHKEGPFPIIHLTDTQSGCKAEIYATGGLLNAFTFPVSEKEQINIVDGFSSPEDMLANITNGFKSTKLSPFVCRMHQGKYTLNKKEYIIQKHFLSGHAIHGILFDAPFTVTDTFANAEKAAVTLEYHYQASDAGYPFPFTMMIHWQLATGKKLTVTTTVFHHNQEAIPMADGWHPYFTLGTSVDECTLQFDSDIQLEYDADLLPTGKKISDSRFKNGISLAGIELDNSFELSTAITQPICVLQNNKLKLTIEPGKNYPILQIYIPPHRNSIAIENLSGAPDNFNNGMGLIMLAANEQKVFRTTYRISNIE